MHWVVAAPFFEKVSDPWLDSFVPGSRHTFTKVSAPYVHDRSRKSTGSLEWVDYFTHGFRAWTEARKLPAPTGVITVFPQLALTVAVRKRLSMSGVLLVAYCFNVGSLHKGARQRISAAALQAVDRFVVHSRHEIAAYSEWLGILPERFSFVPLQRPVRIIDIEEEREAPFVLSMGSAHRDYALLLEVLADLGYRSIIVASSHALSGHAIPANVTVLQGLSITECHELLQRARVSVVPVRNSQTASGQVTLIDSLMFGRPTVATACIGTEDYMEDGKTGLLVEAGNRQGMRDALQSLWEDEARRRALGSAARRYAVETLSDHAAGVALGRVLDGVEGRS